MKLGKPILYTEHIYSYYIMMFIIKLYLKRLYTEMCIDVVDQSKILKMYSNLTKVKNNTCNNEHR